MFVEYADNHSENKYRFVDIRNKEIMLSRDFTWLNWLYEKMNHKKYIESRYNIHEESKYNTFLETDIKEVEKKYRKIPQ